MKVDIAAVRVMVHANMINGMVIVIGIIMISKTVEVSRVRITGDLIHSKVMDRDMDRISTMATGIREI